jgi:spore coat polysaccharide biosynthesis predicted glycosyltransferase SpsG
VGDPVVFVADAGDEAGLGHISRSSAIALALRCRGVEVSCHALGPTRPFECDGVTWAPLAVDAGLTCTPESVVVVDSYRLGDEFLATTAESARLVVLRDDGALPPNAALVVAVASRPTVDDERVLSGPAYAALRPAYWGLPVHEIREVANRVLVTMGSGDSSGFSVDVALALRVAHPHAKVTMVRGPFSFVEAPAEIETLDAPASLLEVMLASDLIVTAGGQTMLEAAACGSPSVVVPLAENQRAQTMHLARMGAVYLVDRPEPNDVVTAVGRLMRRHAERRDMSRHGQRAVDGYGALRVAFQIARLAGKSSGRSGTG